MKRLQFFLMSAIALLTACSSSKNVIEDEAYYYQPSGNENFKVNTESQNSAYQAQDNKATSDSLAYTGDYATRIKKFGTQSSTNSSYYDDEYDSDYYDSGTTSVYLQVGVPFGVSLGFA